MAKMIWPFSLMSTELNLHSVLHYRVIENLRTNQPPRFVSYSVLMGLLSLLALSVYFQSIDEPVTAVVLAISFAAVIGALLLLDRLLTRCAQCASKLTWLSTVVAHQNKTYRVSGHVCRSCTLIEISMCINTKLESDS